MKSRIAVGKNGFPVLMADVPNAGTAVISTGSRANNKRHDARSGKFTSGGGPKKAKAKKTPANHDPNEYNRFLAAAREAARELGGFEEEDIREFLARRAKNPDKVDIQKFLQAVRNQRIVDVTDLLDQQMRSEKGSKSKVRVTAPRKFVEQTIRGLNEAEVSRIIDVLSSRGHDEKALKKHFDGTQFKNQVKLSDEYGEDDEDLRELIVSFSESVEAIKESVANPVAPVLPERPEKPPTKKIVERDPETGLITSVYEAPIDG